MFCGGSIFNSMMGKSRSILDEAAFDKLIEYYIYNFPKKTDKEKEYDKIFYSFYSMISPERNKKERESFFQSMGNRVKGISLKKDIVIPYNGILKALGEDYASDHIQLLDFEYEYTHENPFPVTGKIEEEQVNASFKTVFNEAAHFLT